MPVALLFQDSSHELISSAFRILHFLPMVQKMWFQNLVPGMEKEVADHGSEGLDAVLEPVLLIVSECTRDEYQTHVLPLLRKIFPLTKSIHVSLDV